MKKENENTKIVTKVYFLGGLEEVGKNCYCIEHGDEIFMFDCGIKMPGVNSYGFEHIIPSFDHIVEQKDRLKAVIITHGHEDHIGALPYLIRKIHPLTIYAPRIAYELIKRKLNDWKIEEENYNLIEIDENWTLKTKNFFIEPYNTVHSIPDTYGYFITTDNGIISTTADYRFDLTPLGPITNFNKLIKYNELGCTLLLSDSTNSLVAGYTKSETEIVENIDTVFLKCTGRLIITSFSSNIYRLQEIVKTAIKYNRKILLYGKSMERNINASLKLNYIDAKNRNTLFIKTSQTKNMPANEILILCTGSQGETLSALQRIANGRHQIVKIRNGDTILFSSNPIPGNYLAVEIMVNKLSRLGAKIIKTNKFLALHTSGHATQNEQKLMFALLRPKYFIPMHGEYNMLVQHTKTAMEMGIPKENNFVCRNGDVVSIYNNEAYLDGQVHSGVIYIDGNINSDSNNKLISERETLLNHGLISVIYTINRDGNKLQYNPIIVSRGTFYVKENTKLIYQLQTELVSIINDVLKITNYYGAPNTINVKNNINEKIINASKNFIYTRKKRNPRIIPVVLLEK